MDYTNTQQPKPFASVGPQLYAPRDGDDAVPNPFAIPPEWLEAWQAEADDKAAMEAAAAAAKDAEDLKAESAKAETAAAKDSKKTDGIIASLSAAIPKFFQDAEKKIEKAVEPEKKASGFPSLGDLQSAVSGAFKGGIEQVQGALGGLAGQATQTATQAGTGAGTGAGQGFMASLTAGVPGLSQAAQTQFKPLVGAAHEAVQPLVEPAKQEVGQFAYQAGAGLGAGAKSQAPSKTETLGLLGVDTTTLVVGGVAVLGVLGLGAYLLSGDKKFGATSTEPKITEELQKMLDRASWTRASGSPAVKWLEAPKSERHASSLTKPQAMKDDSGLGAGVAIVGGASALAVLIGYLLKGGFESEKTASGAYGTGLGGASPSGHIAHRSSWQREHQAGAPLLMQSSPLHPFKLADALGMSKELLHLDPTAILGTSPSQKDHDDFFAGYPIGHKSGSDNCDAARLNKNGVVYMKDPAKSQPWDNGWLKGYYDGWVAEGCKATLVHAKTASGPGRDARCAIDLSQLDDDYLWTLLTPQQKTAASAAKAAGMTPLQVVQAAGITANQLCSAIRDPLCAIDLTQVDDGALGLTAAQKTAALNAKASGASKQDIVRAAGITVQQLLNAISCGKTASGPISSPASGDTWRYFYVFYDGSHSLSPEEVSDEDVAMKDQTPMFAAPFMFPGNPIVKVQRVRTSDGNTVTVWVRSIPVEKTSSGPDSTWNYVFTYADGTSTTDPTPTPNSQVSVTDNLVADTARASHAVKVDRVRFPDNFKITVWTSDKSASGPPAIGILAGLWNVLLPWQRTAAINYKATHPSFGNDYQEAIRVLAITPDQIKKANASYQPFAGADAAAAVRAQTPPDAGSQWAQAPTTTAASSVAGSAGGAVGGLSDDS